ncbi:ATP-dependent DNA helicase [Candidatus Puniceispirillum marinum IMCC1322]|uniref:ATP-dependent DNA helicase n=1 Tax=Puniceispirillum marinum (strain IMCC1322) TaxID=488538 RepID=D5BMY9_PUNMI|nr:ATP-dependent DNA helicase [Candidatus Puniceispirillum marinum IMCC1322]
MICRNAHLCQQRLCVHRHFNLAGYWLANFATIANQHRQWNIVILNKCRQRVDGNTDRRILHDDGRAFTAHIGTGAKPHAFIFFARWNVENIFRIFDFVNHTCQLFAGYGGHKLDLVANKVCNDFLIYGHNSNSVLYRTIIKRTGRLMRFLITQSEVIVQLHEPIILNCAKSGVSRVTFSTHDEVINM